MLAIADHLFANNPSLFASRFRSDDLIFHTVVTELFLPLILKGVHLKHFLRTESSRRGVIIFPLANSHFICKYFPLCFLLDLVAQLILNDRNGNEKNHCVMPHLLCLLCIQQTRIGASLANHTPAG